MNPQRKSVTLLMADDDRDDCLLTRDALAESRVLNTLHFVHDGEELLDYLRHSREYANLALSPRPDLILLDLNMPRKDGREALAEIKADAELRPIPIVVLTTSKAEDDILHSYNLGASAFVTKPVTFEGLVEAMKSLGRFWFEIVELPSLKEGG
jgi:CheY-like chemotaxis protein